MENIDYEIVQYIKINELLHKISYYIRCQYKLYNNMSTIKKMYHITLNWFMYQLGLRQNNSSRLLNGLTKFNYDHLIIDIFNFCSKHKYNYSLENIKIIFNFVDLFIKSEFQLAKRYLDIYKSADQNIVEKSLIKDNYLYLTYITDKHYYYKKYQNIYLPATVKIHIDLYNKLQLRLGENPNTNQIIFITMTRYKLYETDKIGDSLSVDDIYNVIDWNGALELFASPINCHLQSFCSIFPDIEHHYGSIGTAFTYEKEMEFWLKYKTVVCNPPYCSHIMTRMSEMLLRILEYAMKVGHTITFIISVPDWRNGESFYQEYTTYTLLKPYIRLEIVKSGQYNYFDYFNYKPIFLNTTKTLFLIVSTSLDVAYSEEMLFKK